MIGYYVHYHGAGHRHRTEAILRHLGVPATVITSRVAGRPWEGTPPPDVLDLPCDIDDVPDDGLHRSGDVSALHYAPLHAATITDRIARLADWIRDRRPELMVVDVSSEVSMLTRLMSVPQIVMRQHGLRDDPGHASAYEAADLLLAPFPELLEDDRTPNWIREKTRYVSGFCRLTGDAAANVSNDGPIVVLKGRGGSDLTPGYLAAVAASVPDRELRVLGVAPEDVPDAPPNLRALGWVADPTRELSAAAVVFSSAGHNSVMELGRLRRRFVAVAEERPFDEQTRKVAILQQEGLAVGRQSWPEPADFEAVVRQAEAIDADRWDAVYPPDRDGAAEAAAVIREHAAEIASRPRPNGPARPRRPTIDALTIVRGRQAHLDNQAIGWSRSHRPPDRWIIVAMGQPPTATPPPGCVVHIETVPADDGHLPLARARNRAAEISDADHLLFLDVDCIASPELVDGIHRTLSDAPGLWMADVGYLPSGATTRSWTHADLASAAVDHPLLPDLSPGQRLTGRPHHEFWSLAFGIRRKDFRRIGGFDESFTGYGGEDTDFAFAARDAGLPFGFTGYRTFHQHHGVCKPPLNHFADIVDNAYQFRRKWGVWPMDKWLHQFRQAGYVEFDPDRDHLKIVRHPDDAAVAAAKVETPAGF